MNGPKNCIEATAFGQQKHFCIQLVSFNRDLKEFIFVVGSKVEIEAARQNPKSPRPLCQRLLQIWQTQGTLKFVIRRFELNS